MKNLFKKIYRSVFDKSMWISCLAGVVIWAVYWVIAATIFFFVVTHPGWLKLVYIGFLALVTWGIDEYVEYRIDLKQKKHK